MTAPVEEQALRVLLPSFRGPELPPEWARLLADGAGGICLFGSNLTGRTEDAAALTAAIHAARPGALVAVDEEGGDVTRLHVRTGSPVLGAAALGAIDDLALTEAVGSMVGADLAAVGIDLDLGPVADVNSNPDNPVIGTRSFGADADLVARHVAGWVGGLQAHGVAACVKHFPGHGDTAQDSHLALPVVDAPLAALAERELVPFAGAVAEGAAAVMTSHILLPAIDDLLPATLAPAVLEILRDRLGFQGAIVSDALDMVGASAGRGIPEAAVLALAAGCDLLCIGPLEDEPGIRRIQAAIVEAVRTGRLPAARLADAVARVDRLATHLTDPSPSRTAPDENVRCAGLTEAARGAFVVEGELPDLAGARVVSVGTPANIAVGEGPWGLEPDVVVPPGDVLPAGPVVVQVRDAHRRPEVGAMLQAVEGPAVVVEWGWPGERTGWADRPHPRICTRGSSRPAVRAVEGIMREAGWDR
ncbi:glycoside hydrolase family 3 protein [Nocardioides panacisoli]|uniref:Glycoside hydrolase family 3 protein n=1 Tax=Nocardioides panacisoli TaxID=627624 RepID=A0ABP7HXL9_9ACTN